MESMFKHEIEIPPMEEEDDRSPEMKAAMKLLRLRLMSIPMVIGCYELCTDESNMEDNLFPRERKCFDACARQYMDSEMLIRNRYNLLYKMVDPIDVKLLNQEADEEFQKKGHLLGYKEEDLYDQKKFLHFLRDHAKE